MADTIPFSFGPDTNPGRSVTTGDSRIVNAFVEPVDQGKNGVRYAIHADPGLTTFVTFDEASIRGHFVIGSALYVIAGETLYKVSAGGATTEIGTILGTRAIIAAVNQNAVAPQAAIVADTVVYELQADILQEWQDADLPPGVVSVDYIDGYFFLLLQTGTFYITGINNTSIDPLDFATAEGKADVGIRAFVFERRVYIFGGITTELWLNTGNADFPFERDSTFIERGALTKMAIVALDNAPAFIDDVARVVRLQGYTPGVISNQAVESDIRRTIAQQSTDQIEGFVYFESAHEFYVLSGPDWTWVYDVANKLWHQKKSYLDDRWIGRTYIRVFDKHIVGSNDSGVLFEMNRTFDDEAGEFLIIEMNSANLGPWPARVSWYEANFDLEVGVGDGTAAVDTGTNPELMLSWSDDGGKSYQPEIKASLGKIGEYLKTIRFTALGESERQGRTWKLKVSAAVRRVVIQAEALVEVLRA